MFAAAMLYSCPGVECSIYSTCKRISQKLLRNVIKFLDLIYIGLGVPRFKIIRSNMEELVIKGPESEQDVRIVNSYPSKVTLNILTPLQPLPPPPKTSASKSSSRHRLSPTTYQSPLGTMVTHVSSLLQNPKSIHV